MSRDQTSIDPAQYKSSYSEYEAIETDHEPDCDVKMDANPAYQASY